jgi:Flp pilus assembly protein TadD
MAKRTRTRARRAESKPDSHRSPSENRQQEAGQDISARRASLICVLAPPLLAFLATVNTLWNGFATDDRSQVLANNFIKDVTNLPLAFTTSVWAFTNDISFSVDNYYRPWFTALFTINYWIFGSSPWGWHLVNVVIHSAVTLLLFVTLNKLTSRRSLSSVAACLFATHPVHVESVAWVSGVTDPLASLFLLPAFYFYLRYREEKRAGFLALMTAFYFLALMSKEVAVALPLVILYFEIIDVREPVPLKRRISSAAKISALFAASTLVYFLMRHNALGQSGSRADESPFQSLLSIPPAILKYLQLMIVPWGYSYQHYFELVRSVVDLKFIISLALVAAIGAAVALSRRRDLWFSSVWFLASLLPALMAIYKFQPEYRIQERYLYLPSMGFCLAVAAGVEWLAARKPFRLSGRIAAATVVCVLIGVWGVAGIRHSRTWDNSLSVFRNCVAVAPDLACSHATLAQTNFEFGWPREAEAEARRALELDPSLAAPYLSLSFFASRSGRLDEAINWLERGTTAVTDTFGKGTILTNLGLLHEQRKDFRLAEEKLLESIEVNPRAVGWFYAGQFYFNRERYEEARAMFEKASDDSSPNFAPVRLRLAWVYDRLGRRQQAIDEYLRYMALAPADDEDRKQAVKRVGQLQTQ